MRAGLRRLRTRAGASAACVALAALALLGAGPPGPISLRTLEGAEVRLVRDAAGPDLVLHFWASWCPECGEELPSLARAASACEPGSVRVIAVNVGETPARVREFVAAHGVDVPVFLDPNGKAWRGAGLWGLPSNLVWTREGLRTDEGAASAGDWRARLRALGCAEEAASP
jgi:peroxiredoxin